MKKFKHIQCVDDFAGNSVQPPCWADIYSKGDKKYLYINASYFHKEGLLPKFQYLLEISDKIAEQLIKDAENLDNEEIFIYDLPNDTGKWIDKPLSKEILNQVKPVSKTIFEEFIND